MCKITEALMLIGLLSCAIYDWRRKEIPIIYVIGIGFVAVFSLFFLRKEHIADVIGGALLGLSCLLVSKWTRQAVGYGDSLLILVLGVYMGGIKLLQLLFIATTVAAFFALFCLWKRKWKRNATIPFVPFIMLAYVGVMFI
jgi:leader peptidase (prepilin peptidase)/N-methyltransferase